MSHACRRNWVSINKTKNKKQKSLTGYRNMPFSVAKGSCNTRKENMQTLCPSVTLQYIFKLARVLPCLWYTAESRPPTISPTTPHALADSGNHSPDTLATSWSIHSKFLRKIFFFASLLSFNVYIKKNLARTSLGTLTESISLLKTSDMVLACSLEPFDKDIRNLL